MSQITSDGFPKDGDFGSCPTLSFQGAVLEAALGRHHEWGAFSLRADTLPLRCRGKTFWAVMRKGMWFMSVHLGGVNAITSS